MNKMDSKNIRIIFFIPEDCENEHETSEGMQQAFQACKQNGIKSQWTPESDFNSLTLNKTDIIVFQSFKGICFDKVQSTKSVIVGPWCLLTCLTQGIHIPNFPWPIYSVAMNNCTVATSAIAKAQRLDIQTKIQHMGGFYSPDLVRTCTHLITDSVKSEKYIRAAETGLKILLPSWIYDVWETSCNGNICCNDEELVSKHRCPTFHKLVICCTGLTMAQRNEVAHLIEKNGGTYKEQLHISTTDILICNSGSASNKYLAAKKRNIKCVSLDWVKDSVKNGYAMPDTNYSIKISTSTPTKDAIGVPPNFSMISNIGNATQLASSNDTIEVTLNISSMPSQSSKKRKSNNEHNELVDAINIQKVKMAGPFLDGCGICLVGFGIEQREKLCKVLNFGGATRYDDISERVTHIIVGDVSSHDLKQLAYKDSLRNIPVLSIQWLLDSLIAEHPINEEKYIISAANLVRPDSPLSKRGLHVLRQNGSSQERIAIVSPVKLQEEAEIDVAKQYLRSSGSAQEDTLARLLQDAGDFHSKQFIQCNEEPKPQDSNGKRTSTTDKDVSSTVDESSQPAEPIFDGLKFIIAGFADDIQVQVKHAVEDMHGKVMSNMYKGVSDYAVVPVFSKELLKRPVTHVVTDLWITECWQENELRPVEYFHQPISVKEGVNPLRGCVITISNYVNYERNFLRNLIKELGGICQEQLSKITCPKSSVIACTHLVTPDATGKKYTAAVKWNLFVINKDWLLACARSSKREPEHLHSIDNSKRLTTTTMSAFQLETPSKVCIDTSKPKPTPQIKKHVQATSMESPRQSDNTSNATSKTVQTTSKLSDNTPPMMDNVHNNQEAIAEITPVHKILTEARTNQLSDVTPVRIPPNILNTSEVSSQLTPVRKILEEAKRANLLGTPAQLPYPKAWDHVDTPDTPLGAFIKSNPSPNLRKDMLRYLNSFPDRKPRRDSTPLSELKRKLWDKICPPKDNLEQPNFDFESEESDEMFENILTPSKGVPDNVVGDQLQQLYNMLTSSGGERESVRTSRQSIIPVASSDFKDSQPNTVGWDYCTDCDTVEPNQKPTPRFMFTGLEQEVRQSLTLKLESIGAVVVELNSVDTNCTHLICSKPTRNEKILASMAAGKWILHSSYVEKCTEAGRLVDEESFEFGNPKSFDNIHLQADKENEGRFAAIHYWRKEIARRGYGPFHDMKAIVISKKKEPLERILQAGGAMVVDASPPFFEQIHATHCIIDVKSVSDLSVYIPLARRGIYCVNVIFVNDYLQRTVFDARDVIIPDLVKFY